MIYPSQLCLQTLITSSEKTDRFSFASKAKGGIRHTAEHIKLAFLFLLFGGRSRFEDVFTLTSPRLAHSANAWGEISPVSAVRTEI